MKELLEAFKALERLGASWKVRRVTKTAPYDTIECTALVQTKEGVMRGLVDVKQGQTYGQTKAEVTCYLDGKLNDKGEFKHLSHSKVKAVKLYEHESNVLMGCSGGFFGVGQMLRPEGVVLMEHKHLVEFAERLIVVQNQQDQVVASRNFATVCARKSANETRAKKALFG